MINEKPIYPVTIFTARYQGIYEGGQWIALNEHVEDIDRDAQGDDIACMEFFLEYEQTAPIGRGWTPLRAYLDLKIKLETNPELDWFERNDRGW